MEALTGRNSPVTGETGRRVFNNVPSPNPHVHRIVAESSSRSQQHQREAENFGRLAIKTTHSWNSQK